MNRNILALTKLRYPKLQLAKLMFLILTIEPKWFTFRNCNRPEGEMLVVKRVALGRKGGCKELGVLQTWKPLPGEIAKFLSFQNPYEILFLIIFF